MNLRDDPNKGKLSFELVECVKRNRVQAFLKLDLEEFSVDSVGH